MGTLSSYRIPRKEVLLGDGEFVAVRGVSLNDLMLTFESHRLDMETVFQSLMRPVSKDGSAEALERTMMLSNAKAKTLLTVFKQSPSLIATLIACACDEPEHMEVVLTMPVSDQLTLAEGVLEMTLKDSVLLKKLMEMANKAAEAAKSPKQN